MNTAHEEVLSFWFPAGFADDPSSLTRQIVWWFRGGADPDVIRRFAGLLEPAERGDLDGWVGVARSRLALIIVLGQFSRSVYRNTARAYANDPKALSLTLAGLELGHFANLESPWEKTFFTLPLGHSEDLENLDLAVRLAEGLVREAHEAFRPMLEFSASQAGRTAT